MNDGLDQPEKKNNPPPYSPDCGHVRFKNAANAPQKQAALPASNCPTWQMHSLPVSLDSASSWAGQSSWACPCSGWWGGSLADGLMGRRRGVPDQGHTEVSRELLRGREASQLSGPARLGRAHTFLSWEEGGKKPATSPLPGLASPPPLWRPTACPGARASATPPAVLGARHGQGQC